MEDREEIKAMYRLGKQIGEALGAKKSQGIVFRLLNIVRAGDWEKFRDSVIHLLSANIENVNKDVLNYLSEGFIERPSKSYAHAFLLGIIAGGGERSE